jgi:hypothetical protein
MAPLFFARNELIRLEFRATLGLVILQLKCAAATFIVHSSRCATLKEPIE